MLKPSPLRDRLLAPLYVSLFVLALAAVARTVGTLYLGDLCTVASVQVAHTLLVQREDERLLSAALTEQSELRGYLLAREWTFLIPYNEGHRNFENTLARLGEMVEDNPVQTQKLQEIDRIHRRWLEQFVGPALSGMPVDQDQLLSSKVLFDPLKALVDRLQQEEDRQLGERSAHFTNLIALFSLFDLAGCTVMLCGIAFNVWLLHRRIEVPLGAVTAVGQAWGRGELERKIGYHACDELGQLTAVLDGMATDLGERERQAKDRTQKLEDLIAALSHDLRTPLIATRVTLRSMLGGAFGPVAPWQDVLEEYRASNEDLLKLVDNLLEVSRYDAGRKNLEIEPLDWRDLCERAVAQVQGATQARVPIRLCLGEALPAVWGDAVEIRRVVQNLLDNAVRVSDDEAVELGVRAEAGAVRVHVRDWGPGIAEAERERLFLRFIQGRNRRGGAGLGLYLCRQIVVAHGGTIGVESTPGEGSTFWFTLRRADGCLSLPASQEA